MFWNIIVKYCKWMYYSILLPPLMAILPKEEIFWGLQDKTGWDINRCQILTAGRRIKTWGGLREEPGSFRELSIIPAVPLLLDGKQALCRGMLRTLSSLAFSLWRLEFQDWACYSHWTEGSNRPSHHDERPLPANSSTWWALYWVFHRLYSF